MILNRRNVNRITNNCLYGGGRTREEIEQDKDDPDRIDIETIRVIFSFSKKKLDHYKNDILMMIDQLFTYSRYYNLGWKQLNEIMCDYSGNYWGDLYDAEEIVALGIGIGKFHPMDEKEMKTKAYPTVYINDDAMHKKSMEKIDYDRFIDSMIDTIRPLYDPNNISRDTMFAMSFEMRQSLDRFYKSEEYDQKKQVYEAFAKDIEERKEEIKTSLQNYFTPKFDLDYFDEESNKVHIDCTSNDDYISKAKNVPILNLNFPTRLYNILDRVGIKTIGDICKFTRTELFNIKNIGITSVVEIRYKIHQYQCKLADE